MNQAVCLSNHTNAEHFLGSCLRFFHQAGPPQRVDSLAPIGNKRKVSFPGHNDALPLWESNLGPATFRSLS